MDINPIGVNPAFRVVDELIRPTDLKANNLVKLKKGSFYLTGLALKTVEHNVPFTDVVVKNVDSGATEVSSETVYRYLHFPNGIVEDLYITYYYFDGSTETERTAFLSTLDGLDSEDSNPDYRSVQDKPHALGNNTHQHNVNILYGLDGIGLALTTLLDQSISSLDNMLSSVLADIQGNRDNRLKTNDKTIVGAINEIVAQVDGVDLTQIQSVSSQALNTADKTIVGAINELKAKVVLLQSLTSQGLTFEGTLATNTTLSIDGNKSKLWAITDSCEITAPFSGEGVVTKSVVNGDIVYLDGVTQTFLHHNLGEKVATLIEGNYLVTNDDNPSVSIDPKSVSETLTMLNEFYNTYGYNNPNAPLLGTLVGDIDLSQAPAGNTGFYLIGKVGINVTIGNPAVVLTPSLGTGIYVTQGSYDYATKQLSVTTPELSHNMPDTGEVRIIKALEKLETELADKVSTYGNGIEYSGYITGGTYNLTSATGTFLLIVSGTQCDIIIPDNVSGAVTHTLYYGDMVYRKQSTGEYIIARIGKALADKLDDTSGLLETNSQDVIQALLEIENGIPYINSDAKVISTLPTNGNGEYLLPAPNSSKPKETWFMDVTGTVVAAWDGLTGDTPMWRAKGTIIIPNNDFTKWETTGRTTGTWLNILKRCYGTFVGAEKTVTAEINRVRNTILGSNEIMAGDLITTGELKPKTYALPCDGKTYSITKYPVLGTLMKDNSGGDGKSIFRIPKKQFKLLELRDEIQINTYLNGYLSALGNRALGGSGEIAVTTSGLTTAFINVNSATVYYRNNITGLIVAHNVPEGQVRAIVAIPNTERFYVLTHTPLDGDNPGNFLYMYDPFDEKHNANFTLYYTGIPDSVSPLIVDDEDSNILYQVNGGDTNSSLYRFRVTEVNSYALMANFPNTVNSKRLSPIMKDRQITWVDEDTYVVSSYNVDTNIVSTFAMEVSSLFNSVTSPYSIEWNKNRDMWAVTFTTSDNSTADYKRYIFWYDVNFDLVKEQEIPTISGNGLSEWNYIVSITWCPTTDALYAFTLNGSQEILTISESRLHKGYYIKT